MANNSQTIRKQPMNCLSVFDHFEELALKELTQHNQVLLDFMHWALSISQFAFKCTRYVFQNQHLSANVRRDF